jgi:hypothetical protein
LKNSEPEITELATGKVNKNLWMFTYIGFVARQATMEHLLLFLRPAVVE